MSQTGPLSHAGSFDCAGMISVSAAIASATSAGSSSGDFSSLQSRNFLSSPRRPSLPPGSAMISPIASNAALTASAHASDPPTTDARSASPTTASYPGIASDA
ncbi:uncharacterized protein MICPUCDRAFT_43677 [Micromonas pusilla CCMP1545]|uniref:Predicted protein n=1 Tax=Micromonas pusilla (strain CCMP1545) TaxID=564608 RepID=C1NA23_MICPC|nr:uncharacterized protein MICPUCDRAFT_43677 [Micromonas pusilla CCMP1545]EEH51048.1 predicted protein [Micromonas pusilla CCMP1545]|eukprot:XP_003064714.1 predicted protein [Micromonas pusilla CCMP1545]